MYEIIIGKAIGSIKIGMKREDEVGFTSNQLGFGACAYYDDDDEDEVARIESVQVAVRNFW